MKKILIALLLLVIPHISSAATTWYVRDDGGTSTQCTGTTNAAYPGSGSGQACAFSHPAWVLGTTGTTQLMAGGDTMIIKDTQSNGTSQAQYMLGSGMPNVVSGNCADAWSYDCKLNVPPSGPDSAHPTRILGSSYSSCTSKPQLWGTKGIGKDASGMIRLSGASNIDIECIEITDHSNCGFRVGSPTCSENWAGGSGTYAVKGIYASSGTNFVFKNLDIHGLSWAGIHMGNISGITFDNVKLYGNYGVGWDGDVGASSSMTGIIDVTSADTRYNGCSEVYPRSSTFNSADYTNCTDQNDNPPGYGDGWGFYNTSGDWRIKKSIWANNVSDGLDLLYGNNDLDISIDKSLFEGNVGNQLKITARNFKLTNSVLVATCKYISDSSKVKNTGTFVSCRANGSPISATTVLGSNWKIYNNTAYTGNGTGGSPFIEVVNRNGSCNGTETYEYKNNVLVSAYNGSTVTTNWVPYYNGLSGACSTAWNNSTTSNSIIYNFQTTPSGGTNSSPQWASSIVGTLDSNLSKVYLQNTSPAKGAGASGLTYWNTSSDYNSFPQNSPVDEGALQYGSTATSCTANGSFCSVNGDCCSTYCVSNACSSTPSCTNNGNSCSLDSDCCSGSCCSGFCAASCSSGASNGLKCIMSGKITTSGKSSF